MSRQSVLVIAPNWIGDAVMSLPLIAQLHQDNYEIDVLATPWVAPVYEACDSVRRVIGENFQHGKLQLGLRWQISRALRRANYAACYILPNSWKSLLIPIFAGIPNKIAYNGEARQLFLTRSLPNPQKTDRPSMVGHYLALASLPSNTAPLAISNAVFPRLTMKKDIQDLARGVLVRFLPESPQFFILAPGAEFGPAKQWPASHFSQIANLLLEHYKDHGVLIIGSFKDSGIADQIIYGVQNNAVARIQNLCGKIPLNQAMALVSLSSGLISNDSGMMHIGAALGLPQVAIFGSSDPAHTPPLSDKASVLYLGLDCSPCHQRKCPLGHTNCLVQISPVSVFKEFQLALARKG